MLVNAYGSPWKTYFGRSYGGKEFQEWRSFIWLYSRIRINSHKQLHCLVPPKTKMHYYKKKGRQWHSPYIPHKHWHHSDIQMICLDRQNRACKHAGVEVVKEGLEQVPQNWCSEFQLLKRKKEYKWMTHEWISNNQSLTVLQWSNWPVLSLLNKTLETKKDN